MNFKNKSGIKKESFYIILFLVLAIVATIIAIAVRNSSKDENAKVPNNSTSIASSNNLTSGLTNSLEVEEQQGPVNTLQVRNDEDLNEQEQSEQTQETQEPQETQAAETTVETNVSENEDENQNDVAVEVLPQEQEVTENNSEEQNSEDENNTETSEVSTTQPMSLLKPLAGQITTEFDKFIEGKTANGNQWVSFSNGIEIAANIGEPVKAAGDGEITSIEQDLSGAIVTIKHENALVTVYKNLDKSSLLVKVGDRVTQNQQIGNLGDAEDVYIEKTPHLYFQVIRNGEYQDPLKYIRS